MAGQNLYDALNFSFNSIMDDLMIPASAPVVENAEYVEVTTAEPEKTDAIASMMQSVYEPKQEVQAAAESKPVQTQKEEPQIT